jgi:anaerobic selenocysteine-containing dehydrogenase
MFSYVRLSDGGIKRFDNPRSEVSILAEIGQQIFQAPAVNSGSAESTHPLNWKQMQSHSAIRTLMAELVPGYEQIGSFDQGGKEFHVPGRAVTDYRFPTASGKAKFHAVRLPDLSRHEDQLRLMTMRSEGQFNSVVYDEEDLYRGQERRDVLLMNEADMRQRGLTADQRVKVRSSAGEMRYIMVRPFNIRAGNVAMYYPESNVLVPHDVDPLSKTPAFKSVLITVEPEVVSVN